ncbi:hypothetical protein OHB01_37375 [Microbispora hainanensis]|jgi:hypothetical protein|uniref:Uncharacterized protein n=1 Tax=Microbispora hainanensis TaxID=568844 RepID=A0ABZ1T0N7_9ACTN|nr:MULTISPECIES: hypothetical protein [Microbispora]NJP23291.1 hypothetical protein [Microbispora sp. CL1-1]TQS16367.1 hypothetical protein FLW53_03535 [Microbispora sp. SCL1-1]
MSDIEPVGLGFVARYRDRDYAAAVGPGGNDVVLFSETPQEGFTDAGGYWRLRVSRAALDRLTLLRTVGAFGGEPCLVLDEDDGGDGGEGGLHIAYTGHNGLKAEALGYWLVDHGAYEVVVPREEVHAIRVERVPVPLTVDRPDGHEGP